MYAYLFIIWGNFITFAGKIKVNYFSCLTQLRYELSRERILDNSQWHGIMSQHSLIKFLMDLSDFWRTGWRMLAQSVQLTHSFLPSGCSVYIEFFHDRRSVSHCCETQEDFWRAFSIAECWELRTVQRK